MFNKFVNYVKSNRNGIFASSNIEAPYNDLNTFPVNEIGVYGSGVISLVDNTPSLLTSGFTITSFNYTPNSQSACVQLCFDFNNTYIAYRINVSDTWSAWKYVSDTTQLLSQLTDLLNNEKFEKYMLNYENVLPSTTLTNNSIIDYATGNVVSSQYTTNYQVTDYIPINYLDIVGLGFVRGANLCGGALYDSEKHFVRTIWGTDDWSQPSQDSNTNFYFINTFENVAYLRYNIVVDSLYPKANNYVYVGSNILNKTQLLGNQIFYVGANRNGTNTFKTLKECSEYILNNNIFNSTVYVDSGIYDLISEYTQEYLDSIVQTQNKYLGLLIGNNTHYIFNENAKIKFLYNGNNTATANYFSPLNIYGSCIIENANIECTNARYCVHEDVGAYSGVKPNQMIVKYKNCVMKHNGATVSTGDHSGYACIGGGCSNNSLSIIEGGIYHGAWNDGDISYHNYFGTDDSRIVIKNAWIYRTIRLATFQNSIVNCEISGNRLNSLFTYNNAYFKVTEWNNTIQTNS